MFDGVNYLELVRWPSALGACKRRWPLCHALESLAMIATAYTEVSAPSRQQPSAELYIGLGTA